MGRSQPWIQVLYTVDKSGYTWQCVKIIQALAQGRKTEGSLLSLGCWICIYFIILFLSYMLFKT